MIQTEQLSFCYKKTDLPFLFPDLQCQAGQALLVLGNSGVGKTTLLHLLAGILQPTAGKIIINNSIINHLSAKKLDHYRGKNIGLVLQQNHFIQSLSVLQNIELAAWIASGKKQTQKAKTLLQQLDLQDQQHKNPTQLSIGQQQRASIARALINNPSVLLADEPTANLDDTNALLVANLLNDLAKKHQSALIIVTHDFRLKQRFNHQILLR